MSSHGVPPFLDVLVEAREGQYVTNVYRKPTNTGLTMNALQSECSQRYKWIVVRAFVRRALRVCSTFELLHAELIRVKQLLVNNGYTNSEGDLEVKHLSDNHMSGQTKQKNHSVCTLFYRNYMNSAHKTDERVLKQIVSKNRQGIGENQVRLQIYYRSLKTKNLFMKKTTWLRQKC